MNDGMTELRNRDLASSPRIQGPEPQIQSWAWIFGPVDPLISPHFPLVRAEMREMREAYWIWNGLDPTSLAPWSPRPRGFRFRKILHRIDFFSFISSGKVVSVLYLQFFNAFASF